jgi:hypothetical protein
MNNTDLATATADSAQGPLKYTKYGIGFGFLLVIAGFVTTLLYGYRPAPTQIMKPSFFDSPQEIGAVTLKRFYAPLAAEKVVVLGLPTNQDWAAQIATGFLEAALQNSRTFNRVIIDEQMATETRNQIRALVPDLIELKTNTETQSDLIDALNAGIAANQHILLITPNLYSTHLLPGNAITRLEKLMLAGNEKDDGRIISLFSITVGPLALEAGQEKELDPVCMGSERDGSGTADLGCAIAQAGRYFYRKRILDKEPNARARFTALMQSPRPNDYLLLVREPQNYGKKL